MEEDIRSPLPPIMPLRYPQNAPLPSSPPRCCSAPMNELYPHPSGDLIFLHNPVIGAPAPLTGRLPVVSAAISNALLPTPDVVPPPSSFIYGNASGAGYRSLLREVRPLLPPLPPVPRSFHVFPPNGPFTTFMDGKESHQPSAYTSLAAVPPFSTLPWLRWPEGRLIWAGEEKRGRRKPEKGKSSIGSTLTHFSSRWINLAFSYELNE